MLLRLGWIEYLLRIIMIEDTFFFVVEHEPKYTHSNQTTAITAPREEMI